MLVVQSLSPVWLFATTWTAARQASLSFSISQSLLRLMSLESMKTMTIQPSHPLFPAFSCLQSFPASGSFPRSLLFAASGQSTGASALASVLPLKIQGWFPLELTGLISLLSKNTLWGFPGGPVVKNPPANSGDILWFVVQEDTTCHGAAKLVCHNYFSLCFRAQELQQEKLPQWEAHTLQLDSNPCLPQLQKAMKTQSSPPKNK